MTQDATKHILVVDEDHHVRSALREILEDEGFAISEAADFDTLLEVIENDQIDLVTLDPNLDPHGKTEPARTLNSVKNIPVVIISGQGKPGDRAEGLEAGADDYVLKPFDRREIVIRIQRILERYDNLKPLSDRFRIDTVIVDAKRRSITHDDGTTEELTGLEMQLLELLISQHKQVLSRDEISWALHGRAWSPYDRTIDGHIARLRRKLERRTDAPRVIRSVRGVGYALSADIKKVP